MGGGGGVQLPSKQLLACHILLLLSYGPVNYNASGLLVTFKISNTNQLVTSGIKIEKIEVKRSCKMTDENVYPVYQKSIGISSAQL